MKKILAIFATAVLLSAFALTAAAAEFNFYGSIRYNTISKNISDNNPNPYGINEVDAQYNPEDSKSDRDTHWGLWGHSRVGANIKLSENITGVFELAVGDEDLTVRHYYGEYDFGFGKILIGQTWHPSSVIGAYSSQIWDGDDGLGEHGAFYGGRREMIKLSFGNFALYFIEPRPTDDDDSDLNDNFGDYHVTRDGVYNGDEPLSENNPEAYGMKGDTDFSIPQIAASYTFKYNNITLEGMAAYQHYEFTDNNTSGSGAATLSTIDRPSYGKSFDIDSNFFKIGASIDLAPFTLSGSYGWGDNIGNMGILAYSIYGYTPLIVFSDGYSLSEKSPFGTYDLETKGYTLVAGVKVNDMLSFETGYGHIENRVDAPWFTKKSEAYSYYLQANIKVVDGFTITPEIGKIEYGNPSSYEKLGDDRHIYKFDGGDISYFGAKWQIDF